MGGILATQMKRKEDEALRARVGLDSRQIQLIADSWHDVKEFGTEQAGIVLFKKFFIKAPETFQMFDEFKDLPNWADSKEFRHHCKIVMNIVGSAVGLLRDPDSLESTLEYLGLKHDGFSITQEHFDVMGVELMDTFREALGPKFTPDIERAWGIFYVYIVKVIVMGMEHMMAAAKKV
jgi:hemoglobin-like flavoprotein